MKSMTDPHNIPYFHCLRFLTLALITTMPAVMADLKIEIQPNPVYAGEPAQLQLISDSGRPELENGLPRTPGLQWTGGPYSQQSVKIINSRRTATATTTYQFTVAKPGTFTLPALRVNIGRKTFRTDPQTITVAERTVATSNGQQLTYDDLVLGEITYNNSPTPPAKLYVGQEIDVCITIYIHEQLFQNMGYPTLDIPNASFRDYSDINEQSPHFLPTKGVKKRRNNMSFVAVPFTCKLSAKTPGPVQGTISVNCQLKDLNRRRSSRRSPFDAFDDDFFGSRRSVTRTVTLDFPPVTALPLPSAPETGTFLGLIGQWQAGLTLKPQSVRVGEPVTLTMSVTGTGSSDLFAPPKLNCPGFRVFDPEFHQENTAGQTNATITWVMLPLAKDSTLPNISFTTFDPSKDTYVSHTLDTNLTILPPQLPETNAVVADMSQAPIEDTPQRLSSQTAVDILYIKTALTPHLKRPLWKNSWKTILILLILSPLTYLTCAFQARRRDRRSGDHSYRRRQDALKQKSALLKKLRTCPADQLDVIIREQLVPFLTDLLDLPPGSSISATADHLESLTHQELATLIRQTEQASFMPNTNHGINPKHLIQLLSKLTMLAALLAPFLFTPALQAEPASKPTESLQQAREAYDRGDVETADALFRQLEQPGTDNAALLYNQANCAYRLNKPGLALALYEKARRLAPRDSDIRENLNFVRRQLDLPPVLSTRTPAELLIRGRDTLRPDEWLLTAAILFFAWSLTAAICKLRSKSTTNLHIIAGLLIITCLLATWNQTQTTYRPDTQALITTRHATLYSLPDQEGTQLDVTLNLGDQVQIIENRTHSLRIRTGEAEGWINTNHLQTIW